MEEISNEEESNKCYFCKLDLKKESKKQIIELKCCGMKAHKREIFQWYLQKTYCPSCLKEDSKSKKKIMDWGKKQKKK
ncbi:MAG: hypothetical protein H7641_05470 [Candidatus Heimdallarchaeota archaeon]|nr:hypothetical protein [Candidatus Heimdallarchaeota archaeon]MCK4877011.1 hypothetical protein [Candidatus Heimdallarchaeota archaeon]